MSASGDSFESQPDDINAPVSGDKPGPQDSMDPYEPARTDAGLDIFGPTERGSTWAAASGPRHEGRHRSFPARQCAALHESQRCELKRGHRSVHAARTLHGLETWAEGIRPEDQHRIVLDWISRPTTG